MFRFLQPAYAIQHHRTPIPTLFNAIQLARVINDNGTLRPDTDAIHPADAPVSLYGDGLFETIRYGRGGMLLWERHWARLMAGMEALLLPRPAGWNADFFAGEIRRTVEEAGMLEGCRVRVHVYADGEARYTVCCGALPPHTAAISLGISAKATKDGGLLSPFKTCSALPYRIAAREATQAGWDDAVLLNGAGSVVETTRSNIFLARGGTVFANPVADGPVAGVMRAQLLEWMPEWGYSVQESSFKPETLYKEADEIFLTNALRGVMPVLRLFSHRHFGERTLSTTLGERLARMVEQKFIASGR